MVRYQEASQQGHRVRFLSCTHEESISRAGGAPSRGVWGHAPPENFEIWGLGNAISCVFSGDIFNK